MVDFSREILGCSPLLQQIAGQELAKKEYCALVDDLVPGWRGDAQLEV